VPLLSGNWQQEQAKAPNTTMPKSKKAALLVEALPIFRI